VNCCRWSGQTDVAGRIRRHLFAVPLRWLRCPTLTAMHLSLSDAHTSSACRLGRPSPSDGPHYASRITIATTASTMPRPPSSRSVRVV
jgi:hypothetical protein